MKFIKKNWNRLALLSFFLILPVVAFAQNSVVSPGQNSVPSPSNPISGCSPAGTICNPLGTSSTLPVFIKNILNGVLTIGIPIIALAIIYSGFLFVFARGNSEKLTHAKDTLLYTLIGAAILLGAYAIATMISSTILAL
jgi:hypothetical protein